MFFARKSEFLAPFKLSWGHLGALGAILRQFWCHLGTHLGAMLAHLGAMLAHLRAMLAYLRAHVGPCEGYVGPSCPYFGALAHLEPQKRKKSPQ